MGFNRKARKEKDVRNVTERIHSWMPNMRDTDQSVTKLNNRLVADAEIIRNMLSSNKKGERLLNELLSRFTNSSNASNSDYSNPIKESKMYSFQPYKEKTKRKTR